MDNRAWIHTRIMAISDISTRTLNWNTHRDIMPSARRRLRRRRLTNTTTKRRHRERTLPSSTNPRSNASSKRNCTSLLVTRDARRSKIPASRTPLVPRNPHPHNSPSIRADRTAAYSHDSAISLLASSSSSRPYKANSSPPWNDSRKPEERRSKNRTDMLVKLDSPIDSDITDRAEPDLAASDTSPYSLWKTSSKLPYTLRVA